MLVGCWVVCCWGGVVRVLIIEVKKARDVGRVVIMDLAYVDDLAVTVSSSCVELK